MKSRMGGMGNLTSKKAWGGGGGGGGGGSRGDSSKKKKTWLCTRNESLIKSGDSDSTVN